MRRSLWPLRLRTATVVLILLIGAAIQVPASAAIGTTVTFVAYDGQSPVPTATQVAQTDGSANLTLFSALFPSLVYPGHTFDHWSTQAGGGGDQYLDGASYSFANSVILYAQWIGPNHTVTFNENASLNDPVESSQVANVPTPLTRLMSLQPSFANPNFTFVDWNTKPDDTGTAYSDGAVYDFGSAITLYAQWIQNPHSVTFFSNLTSTDVTDVIQTNNAPASLTSISALSFSNPSYTFEGWNTQRNGSGVTYLDQAVYSFSTDLDLYAQWVQNPYSVTFFSNLSSTDSTHVIQTNNGPASLTSISALSFSNPKYTFEGWNTQRNGSGVTYLDQAVYPFSADVDLYAQWSPDQYNLSFSSNSGTGSVSPISSGYGSTVTLPQGSSISRPDYELVGWNTDPQGNGTEYQLGSSINVTGNETLYAVWSKLSCVVSFAIPGLNGKVAPITVLAGDPIHLPSSVSVTKPGFSFAGWYSSPTSGMLVGKGGDLFTPTTSVTLYARWTGNPLVGLEFSDNGGAGHVAERHVRAGLAVAIPGGVGIHRSGYLFRGWASSPRASEPTVRIGTRIVLAHTKVLYALWRHELPRTTPQVLLGSVGVFAPDSSALTPKMRHYIAALAIGIARHNRTLVLLYGYATSVDSAKGSALLSRDRALAVQKQLNQDLAGLNDVGVTVRPVGEGRLSNSVLASFRNVEIFAN
jgi:uncharacterized repeat protein (TIGR02543 family)